MANELHYLEPKYQKNDEIIRILGQNSNIKFVSLSAVDLAGNHTDEKILIRALKDNYDEFMKKGIQTDGSSVYLPEIAEINDARVDLIPDSEVRWFIDYNKNNIDEKTGKAIGTLVIPAKLVHNGIEVCSRSILKNAVSNFESAMLQTINCSEKMLLDLGTDKNDPLKEVIVTVATELEFWVKSPDMMPSRNSLISSETLKEQYWKRTVGRVRTALENSLLLIDDYGMVAEMGHKEVGGISPKLNASSSYGSIFEQLEIDWKYDRAIQAADNEMFAKEIVKDVFESDGLKVSFKAKPIEGAAGSGQHHHIGVCAYTLSGKYINIFSPADSKNQYLSILGYGALMGLLKNYEVINPFVSSTNDAFRRLVPGFEAPVCVVSSLGHAPDKISRNRTVLVDVIRDVKDTKSTRFELRSPNPDSNSFLLISSCLQAMKNAMEYVVYSELSPDAAFKELNKKKGEEFPYLEKDREYLSTEDVYSKYSSSEREELFGKAPRTVFENLKIMEENKEKLSVLKADGIFTDKILKAYKATIFSTWINQLEHRIIKNDKIELNKIVKIHKDDNELNNYTKSLWENIVKIKTELICDRESLSLISKIENAINQKDYTAVNELQILVTDKIEELISQYEKYREIV